MIRRNAAILAILAALAFSLFSCRKGIIPAEISGVRIKPYDTATFNYVFVEAVKLKLMGNGGDALKLLEQAVRINPGSDAAYFQIAQILLAQDDIRNARKYALSAWNIDQHNFWYMMMLAGTYYQEKMLDSAIYFYEKAVKDYPEREGLKITLANLYSEDRKFEKAAGIFNELDKRYGINENYSAGVVKNLMWAKKWDEALIRAQELLKQYPDVILFNGLLAEIYRGKNQPEKAMEVYMTLIERNPDNPGIQLAICDFLIEEKKYDDLSEILNTVLINNRINREEKVSLFARMIENPEIAIAGGNRIILSVMVLEAAYPDDDLILLLRPELLAAQGNKERAASRLEEIITKRPENYYAWEKLMFLALEKGEFKKLEELAAECSSRFNRSFIAKMLYATAATENGKYEVALEESRKAGILAGSNEEMLLQVLTLEADVYYRTKQFEKAFSTFDKALEKNKSDITLLNNYAYYLAEQNLRLKEAEEMSKQVIEKEPGNHTFLDTYAWVLYKRGKVKEAEKIMKNILESAEKPDAEYYEHYGYIMKKRKKCKDAIESWQKALNLDPEKTQLNSEIENCKR
ncbi:MAG: tetratricopeptide repeat protein [Bacteroidales bacterium]|jgi:predicted Zn-dependent protease|nr:tetratricopeptide repeat protein [Bacteroidales bacterium]